MKDQRFNVQRRAATKLEELKGQICAENSAGTFGTFPRTKHWLAIIAIEVSPMYLSNQSLLVILVVGIVAGWLAGQVMRGGGFGLIGDLIVGLIGAFIGDWLLPQLGIHLGVGIVALIADAFIGAVVLLLLLRLVGGAGWGYRARWGRRW